METERKPEYLGGGFYFLNTDRSIVCRTIRVGKPGEQIEVDQPVRVRTIKQAQDALALADRPLAVLYVGPGGFTLE